MGPYIPAVRSHLKLCRSVLEARLIFEQNRPVGYIMRNNHMVHTQTMLTLLEELILIAAHDPDEWWHEQDEVPF